MLIQQIADMDGTSTVQADMWFRVIVTGTIVDYSASPEKKRKFKCAATGNSLVFAYLMVYKKWKAEWEKLTKRKWKDPIFRVSS